MIKKLFFRANLRLWIEQRIGASSPNFEEIFDWVYKAPIWKWRIRFYCMLKFYNPWNNKEQKHTYDPNWKEKAEKLYTFLCK